MVETQPPPPEPAQLELERKLDRAMERVEQGQATPAEAFGRPEDWQLTLGRQRLMLFPASKRWLWWDPLHEDWADTGLSAGEAHFHEVQGRLVARRLVDAPQSPDRQDAPPVDEQSLRPAWMPPQAQASPGSQQRRPGGPETAPSDAQPASTDATTPRFCMYCGGPLTPNARFCPNCGKEIRRE
jgi:hypothetical protein